MTDILEQSPPTMRDIAMEAIRFAEEAMDSSPSDLMCCDGSQCGCQGATFHSYLSHNISELKFLIEETPND